MEKCEFGIQKGDQNQGKNLEITEAACMKNNMGVENLMCTEEQNWDLVFSQVIRPLPLPMAQALCNLMPWACPGSRPKTETLAQDSRIHCLFVVREI